MTNHFIDNHIQPLDLSQENANLRDLLNKSMTENAELLQQATEQQAALNVENEKLARMIDSSAQSRLANMTEAYQDAKKRIDELDATLDKVQNSWLDAKLRIDELTKALDLMNERQRLEWSRAENAEAQYTTLLSWSQAAYKRLGGLMAIGVSMTPDAVTAKLLQDAPANVSAEVDPFISELAADLDYTEKDVYEYAVDSMGASGIQTIDGCHSAGLHHCYGDLWTCVACKRTFCQAEGSTDMIELCNECWMKARAEEAK